MLNNDDKTDLIFKVLITVLLVLLIGCVCSIFIGQEQGGQDLEYKAVLKAKTGVFKFETESERALLLIKSATLRVFRALRNKQNRPIRAVARVKR